MMTEAGAGDAVSNTARRHREVDHGNLPDFDNIQSRDERPERLQIARTLAASDLRLVRLRAGSNIPNVREWQRRATSDLALIETWGDEQPWCNWGLLTGDGLGVLDLDTKSDPDGFGGYSSMIDVEELLQVDLSSLPMVNTASGCHLYFRYEGVLPSRVPWLPHLDVKADGGHQVAAPGTVREVDGREVVYELVRGDLASIPYAPTVLTDAIRNWRISQTGSGRSTGIGGELISDAEAVTVGIAAGERNNTMHRLACRWWREHGVSNNAKVFALAREVWESTPGHESFGWAEVEASVESARRFVVDDQRADARAIELWMAVRRGTR